MTIYKVEVVDNKIVVNGYYKNQKMWTIDNNGEGYESEESALEDLKNYVKEHHA